MTTYETQHEMDDKHYQKGREGMYSENDVLRHVSDYGIELVDLQFTDILGVTKSVTIPTTHLKDAFTHGVWFDGSSIYGFARIQESDMRLRPDAVTYRVLPWVEKPPLRARMICDILTADGERFAGDPRYALQRAMDKAEQMGFTYYVGPELEFFLFRETGDNRLSPAPHDVGSYFDFSPGDEAERVRSEIVTMLQRLKIEVETSHHEVATGQHEIDFKYSDALSSADNTITFKYAVRGIAVKHGLLATFMPKPIYGQSGNGMHVHQSLFTVEGNNAFYDARNEYHLSEVALQFLAGILHHSRALSAIAAPLVNSYKRLTAGYEAPVYVCWAQHNRSALVRVPRYTPGREQSTRLEARFPDPSANPYLTFATMLAAGLDGIEKGMTAPPPVTDDVYEWGSDELNAFGIEVLPGTLRSALDALSEDAVIQAALGDHIYQMYIRAKREEWEAYRTHVSNWELERYLRIT